ncbi:MAG: T9SS type A sorting domain-containing protein [Ignavibacteriae bacterium]|nr:T9SS type A sorting domain-containing protein [Ignavibacteria bacterium]MBI3363759.1 T9SS type A sorting domain-containing protein [Ignavibacteriota bacterium]
MHCTQLHRALFIFTLAALPAFALAQSVHLKIPLSIRDNNGHSAIVYFGVDPSATYCIDPSLGEYELPSDRCGTSSICAYFADSRGESDSCLGNGLLLDYHAFAFIVQADTYRVIFSAQDYPLTLRWPSNLRTFYDSARIVDLSGGVLVKADMLGVDSLVISDATVNQLIIHTWDPKGFVDGIWERNGATPNGFALYQNYPNPFNPMTTIVYKLSAASDVRLEIIDVVGNTVATLVDQHQQVGAYRVSWDAGQHSSGVYFCRLQAGTTSMLRKLLVVK